MTTSKIIWTKTDEAPALAAHALLPVVRAYTRGKGIEVETRDISLAGRIIANFPDRLTHEQKIPDHLTALGELAKTPEANIIKLPNISASIPQLQAAIEELQKKGYDIPDYREEPRTDEERALQRRFATCLGSTRGSLSHRCMPAVELFGVDAVGLPLTSRVTVRRRFEGQGFAVPLGRQHRYHSRVPNYNLDTLMPPTLQ